MDGDSARISAIQRTVDTWAPRDKRSKDNKKKFEQQLKKAIEELEKPAGERDENVEVTSTAIVVGEKGALLHAHDLMPMWTANVVNKEMPWETAAREVKEKTGVDVAHPESGPALVDVGVRQMPDGRMQLDLRFLLFGDGESRSGAEWFTYAEARERADESYQHALEVAHMLRGEAER